MVLLYAGRNGEPMKAFMLWVAVVAGFIVGAIFGDGEVRGFLVMLAFFVVLGALVHVTRRKHE